MEVTIDKFGRILIPKKIRQLLGLLPGQKLELVADEDNRKLAFRLPLEIERTAIELTSFGFPVIQNGQPDEASEVDTVELIKDTREDDLDRKLT